MAKDHAFPILDAFRGMAAIVVVVDHYPALFSVTMKGLAPVHLFFVISGVVVAHAYETRLQNGLSAFGFLRLRMARFYPLYAAGSAASAVLALCGVLVLGPPLDRPPAFIATLVLAAFMLPSPLTDLLYPLNAVAWSLLFEIIINVVYAFTWRRWTTPNLVVLAGLGFVSLLGCRATFHYFETGWAWSNAAGGLASVLYCFPIGVLIFRLYQNGRRLVLPWWAPVGLLAVIALMYPPAGRLGDLWRLADITVAGPLLVASALTCDPPPWARRVCSVLGDASYGLYTLHIAFFGLVVFVVGKSMPWLGWPALLALVAVTLFANTYVDAPIRKALNRGVVPPNENGRGNPRPS